MVLTIFHFDISGSDINDSQSPNNPLISWTLDTSHFDISGNDFNNLHEQNKPLIFVTLDIFHFDISGSDFKDLHPENIHLYNKYLNNSILMNLFHQKKKKNYFDNHYQNFYNLIIYK